MAIHRSGTNSSAGVLRWSCGWASMLSRSMSGWKKRLNNTSPSAPASASRRPMLAIALKYGPTFTANGIEIDSFTAATSSEIAGFHVPAGHVRVGGDEVDVQLQGVGPGVLHHLGVADPAAPAGAVEAGDDRNLHRLLRRGDGFQIFFRAGAIILRLGEIGQRLGEAVGVELVDLAHFLGVVLDLLLEQRGQDGRRGAGLLRAAAAGRSPPLNGQAEITSGLL